MFAYFTSLKNSEKLLLSVLAVVIIAMAFYLLIWEPTSIRLKQVKTQDLPQSSSDLAWVRQAVKEAGPEAGKGQVETITGPLLTVIETTAADAEVRTAISRIKPGDNQTVQVWLDNVAFDDWLVWINQLRDQHIKVQSASIGPEADGFVSLKMMLSR